MESSIALRPSWRVLQAGIPLLAVAMCIVWWRGFPDVAVLVMLAGATDVALQVRRCRQLPSALFLQGMRWWCVTREGELDGPWRLCGRSRRGAFWVSLTLRQGRRRRTLWLQRDMLSREGWSRLHWEMLSQTARLQRADKAATSSLGQRLRASIRNRLRQERPRDNRG